MITLSPNNALWQRDLSVSYSKIGDIVGAQGDLAGALKAYEESLAIRERLAKLQPANADWQRDLAITYARIAWVLTQRGEKAAALKQFRQGRAILVALIEKAPGNAQLPRDLAGFDAYIGALEGRGSVSPAPQPVQAAQ